jgi:soluble lytic murein transglycosylase-like protein
MSFGTESTPSLSGSVADRQTAPREHRMSSAPRQKKKRAPHAVGQASQAGLAWIQSRAISACVITCLAAAAPLAASAGTGIYRYMDAAGVVHFSDVPYDARYRAIESQPRGLSLSSPNRSRAPVQHGFDALIAHAARTHGVDPALVKAVIAAESNFQIEAVSRVGAQGLMQLMPATAAELGVQSPLLPRENVSGGVRYLKAMLDRYGDVERALAAYNAGPAAVDRHGGIPPYRETEAYVKRVLNYYRGYQGQFPR